MSPLPTTKRREHKLIGVRRVVAAVCRDHIPKSDFEVGGGGPA